MDHHKHIFGVISCVLGMMLMFLLSNCDKVVHERIFKRNILFYIATDNNQLDNGGNGDEPRAMINAIRAGWTPGKGEMLIYTDQTNRPPCLLRIKETRNPADGFFALDTIQVFEEENSADAAVLSRIINRVVSDFPADSYGMMFFSHASGWLPEGMLTAPRSSVADRQDIALMNPDEVDLRSLVIDNGNGTPFEMEYDDFAAAIPDHQFDFMIFDACFITDVMMMYELRNKAEYILGAAAEIVSPGFTPLYRDHIMRLYDTRSDVSAIVAGFGQYYMDYITSSYPEDDVLCSATLGVIKMSEMHNLATTVKTALNGIILDESTLPVDSIQRYDRPNKLITSIDRSIRYSDFGDVMAHLAADSLITEANYEAFLSQMAKTVIWKANTKRFLLGNKDNGDPYFAEYDGFFITHHSALSTYIEQSIYPTLNTAYRNSPWYSAIY